MISDYFKMAFTNLSHRKLRTYLTIIGIFIGIAAVVSLISLGQGLNTSIKEQLSKIGGDKLFITPKSAVSGLVEGAKLTEKDSEVVKKVRGVKQVANVRYRTAKIEHANEQIYYYVIDLPQDDSRNLMVETYELEVIEGRMLNKDENFKAVIASDYAKKTIFKRTLHPGDKIKINGFEFDIVGVVKTSDSSTGVDMSVFINKKAYDTIFDKSDSIQQIMLQVGSGEDVERVANDVERALRKFRNLDEGNEDFDVQTPLQLIATFQSIFNIVQAVLIGIAAISMIVGAVGISNTMYTSVVERTKEIGIMKSIGATNEQIRNLFLIESGILGFVGGAVGVAVGIIIGKAIQYGATAALGTTLIRAEFPWPLIAGSLLFAFILGAISGMLPALQAAKLKPVDALRFK